MSSASLPEEQVVTHVRLKQTAFITSGDFYCCLFVLLWTEPKALYVFHGHSTTELNSSPQPHFCICVSLYSEETSLEFEGRC